MAENVEKYFADTDSEDSDLDDRDVQVEDYFEEFLADRTNGRAYATVLRLSVCLSVRL